MTIVHRAIVVDCVYATPPLFRVEAGCPERGTTVKPSGETASCVIGHVPM